jgi:hypothetical protein
MIDPLPKDSPTAFAVRFLGILPHTHQAKRFWNAEPRPR